MKLSEYMTSHNISPAEMAVRVKDISPSGVRKWMYGERIPRPDQMRRLAFATNGEVMPNDFFLSEHGNAA